MFIEVLPEPGSDKCLKNSRLQILHKLPNFASGSCRMNFQKFELCFEFKL